jgi:plasmid stabilization system protein ParE
MYRIAWTPLAFETYQNILDFTLQRWSMDTVLELDEKVQALEILLQTHKHLCPPSKAHPALRRCVITKLTSMLYRVVGNTIQIVAFLDNRSEHSLLNH